MNNLHSLLDLPSMTAQFSGAIKQLQEYSGIPSHFIMLMIGEEIGHGISKKFTSNDIDDLLDKLSKLWKNIGLGEMEVQRQKPLILKIYGCIGCDNRNAPEKRVGCELYEGVMKAIFDDKLNLRVNFRLIESIGRGTGFNICTFEMSEGLCDQK